MRSAWPAGARRCPINSRHLLGSLSVRAIRRFTIRPQLPEPLAPLRGLMLNLRWSWHAETLDLFAAIDPEGWERAGHDPVALLAEVAPERLAGLAADPEFLGRLNGAVDELDAYTTGPRWYQTGRGARGRGVLLARVRHHRSAAAVLGGPRDPGRRSPQGLQ